MPSEAETATATLDRLRDARGDNEAEVRALRTALLAIANLGDGSEHPNAWQRIARKALAARSPPTWQNR